MIIKALAWLPGKIIAKIFFPVTDMLENLAENTDAAAQEYAREHGIDLN